MRKNIKSEIIQTAKKLFNEHGYNGVSTQDISDVMKISKGNLNYHFNKKEDIIEAIVEEMHSHYLKPPVPSTLEELSTFFLNVQNIVKENAFYFWHYTQLGQVSEKIKEIQNTVITDEYALLMESFQLLNKNGSLIDEEYQGQYEQIVKIILLICIYWKPYCMLETHIKTQMNFFDCVWSPIYPLFTEYGKNQYISIKEAKK